MHLSTGYVILLTGILTLYIFFKVGFTAPGGLALGFAPNFWFSLFKGNAIALLFLVYTLLAHLVVLRLFSLVFSVKFYVKPQFY